MSESQSAPNHNVVDPPTQTTATQGLKSLLSRRMVERLGIVLSVGIFLFAASVIRHQLAHVDDAQIMAALQPVRWWQFTAALMLTLANYLLLSGYDLTALHHIGRKLPLPRVIATSFISFSVSNSVGLSFLSGGAVRLRHYTDAGLSPGECAIVILLCTMTFGLGSTVVAAGVLLLEPSGMIAGLGVPESVLHAIALGLLAALSAYLVFVSVKTRAVTAGGVTFHLPGLGVTLWQMTIAVVDLITSTAILYLLLPNSASVPFLVLLSAVVLALVAGIVSHVPGGLGIFESTMLLLLPQIPTAELVGSLLLYRIIYYLIPLTIGSTALLGGIAYARLKPSLQMIGSLGSLAPRVIPKVMALITFMSGTALLFSGAIPGPATRMHIVNTVLPLSVVEISHLSGSVIGLLLLVLAAGLQHRLDAAWALTCLALVAGIITSLLKAIEWEQALLLAFVLACLILSRHAFYRKARLAVSQPSLGWLVAIITVVGASIWLGMFSYKHVEYDNYLWWQFAFGSGAPRFLRASAAVVVITLSIALRSLVLPMRAEIPLPSPTDLARARHILKEARHPVAHLALVGDKALFFNDDRSAFIMFAVRGRSWVAMAEPVGPPETWPELLWQFREYADRFAARPVFYQIHAEHLPTFVDVGLVPAKIGEEAVVDLKTFSLDNASMKDLRYIRRRLSEREGESFEIIQPQSVPSVIAELRSISDYWLADKRAREKAFSVGRFDPGYLAETPIALVRRAGRVVAFANLWQAPASGEISIDLMRFGPEALPGTMDFLFVELLLWAKAEGFTSFTLGMAPLAGLDKRVLAPFWHRAGSFLFRFGEQFYNFQGLRQYKSKFRPKWRARYIAGPSKLDLMRALSDVTALISGGITGLISK